MAVSSPHGALGAAMPSFSLTDVVDGRMVGSADLAGKPALIIFMCNHCPYVRHLEHEIARIGIDYAGRLGMVGICSNDAVLSPGDAPAELAAQYGRINMSFPYLVDLDQRIARAFGAVCTPDVFLYDTNHQLVYRGRLDSSRPGSSVQVTGDELRAAIDAVLAGRAAPAEQFPSIGCGIKWSE